MIIPDLIKLDKTLDDKFFTLLIQLKIQWKYNWNNDEYRRCYIKEKKEFLNNKINFYMTKILLNFKEIVWKK